MDKCELCLQHSGIVKEIESLKSSDEQQWSKINNNTDKINKFVGIALVGTPVLTAFLTVLVGYLMKVMA